jgi:hypothetical protein
MAMTRRTVRIKDQLAMRMFSFTAVMPVSLLVSLAIAATADVAIGQMPTWPGAPGYGGLYNGYTGYRGYETGYPANAYPTRSAMGYNNVLDYGVRPGVQPGHGMIYYSQPGYPRARQAIPYGTRQATTYPSFDGSPTGRIYTGASPVITSPAASPANPPIPPARFDNGEIILFSPPSNTIDVQYSLNGVSYTMKPGTMQKFTNDRAWVIDVNPGTGQNAKFTLSTGNFKFKQSDKGMGLFTTKDLPEAPAPVPDPVPAPVPDPLPEPDSDEASEVIPPPLLKTPVE